MTPTIFIGVASYRNPEKLRATLASIEAMSRTDWRCYAVHNLSEDDCDKACAEILGAFQLGTGKLTWSAQRNAGYAGAVALIQRRFIATEGWGHLAYLDNDIEIRTPGWDEQLAQLLDAHPEVGMAFPGEQPCQIQRDGYMECMWGVGFAFMLTRKAITEAGMFDESIGHQNEADYALRVRMAGYKCACLPSVGIKHHATATNDPAAQERIRGGVVQFVDKWNRYFNGKSFGYHSPNVTRWEDWPPNALYLEEYWKARLPTLNANPETAVLDGRPYDLIRVPRFKDFYRGRII